MNLRATFRLCIVASCLATAGLAGCGHKAAPPTPTATEVSEFHAAVQDGDAAIVDRLLRAKPYLVNARNQTGETPLKVANEKGEQEVADVLRKNGGKE
jgi:ankyrin repeat protein